jgi:putative hydrolase
MKFEIDTHTHTYASGHAYSTLIENAQQAEQNKMKMFCTTDHASSMPGAPHFWFFMNQKVIPRFLSNVGVLRGVEANIINIQGELDTPLEVDDHLDWTIASFHEAVLSPADKATNTETLINVIKSGRVDALGHLGNPNYDIDFSRVIECAQAYNVAIEINNSSLKGMSRIGSNQRCLEIAQIAAEVGAFITTGSDAHFCHDIGRFELTSDLIDKAGVPANKIITHTTQQFLQFLTLRGKPTIKEFNNLY